MEIAIDTSDIENYRLFLKIKRLPRYQFQGRTAIVPDEYLDRLGIAPTAIEPTSYSPLPGLFDYQQAISAMAIDKQKFAVFAECGLGKTLILLEYARHVQRVLGPTRRVLIVSPLMVVEQTIEEFKAFYSHSTMEITQVRANELGAWIKTVGTEVGITNYEALTDDIPQGRLGALILDESSMLKSHYGKWGQTCIRLGRGLDWKLALTGTPAPNDRIEYANHAVFLDAFPTINAFLAKFFVNRGQTDNRWELKPHALRPFYRTLSHWSIFLTNPATYGWKDNAGEIPPIHVHVHDVDMTDAQQSLAYEQTGTLFADKIGGITSRSVLSQIAKGNHRGESVETLKPAYIRKLVESWPEESTVIWCHYNLEQDRLAKEFPDAASMSGDTPFPVRRQMISDFKAGRLKVLISKPKILGFGLNLQIATRQVFSGLQDSYEEFHQAVKRSNRVGSTRALNVHIPITDIERPMIETVLRKAARVQLDTEEQEKEFRNASL